MSQPFGAPQSQNTTTKRMSKVTMMLLLLAAVLSLAQGMFFF
jgi:hypothetical protein